MIGIRPLDNPIQAYEWGSRTALAELLGQPSPAAEPQAELWMGAHPTAPSKIWSDGRWRSLREVIAENPEEVLGAGDAARHGGELPYLFKVLAVARPLSVQAHPDRAQAIAGHRRAKSSYPDAKPKPEIVYALTPFWMLRGFRPAAEIRELLERFGLPDLAALVAHGGVEGLFAAWMDLDGPRLETIAETLRARGRQVGDDELGGDELGGDEAVWIERLAATYPGDRGILAPLVLNLHRLAPGEAVYTAPRVLHAYLEGLGVELMANSDNVVRCALTSKERDVAELRRIVSFDPDRPRPLDPEVDGGVSSFAAEEAGLVLSVLELGERPIASGRDRGAEIVLCVDGTGKLTAKGAEPVELAAGRSFLIPAAVESYEAVGTGRLFRAGTRA